MKTNIIDLSRILTLTWRRVHHGMAVAIALLPEQNDSSLVVCLSISEKSAMLNLDLGQNTDFSISPRSCWGKERQPFMARFV